MAEKKVVKGYIHNVSSVKRSVKSRTPYFDMQIQTESDLIQGVCFSPTRQLEFQTLREKNSPVKMFNIRPDNKPGSTDILMSNKVCVEEVDDVKSQLSTITTPLLSAVNYNQLVNLEGKGRYYVCDEEN